MDWRDRRTPSETCNYYFFVRDFSEILIVHCFNLPSMAQLGSGIQFVAEQREE